MKAQPYCTHRQRLYAHIIPKTKQFVNQKHQKVLRYKKFVLRYHKIGNEYVRDIWDMVEDPRYL